VSDQSRPHSARTFKEDRRAWLVLFVATIVSVAGGYWGLHRAAVPPPDPTAARSIDPRIVVLAFDRVSDRGAESHLDPAILREHLESLRREGFQPITLRELDAFYHRAQPLPAKPVLLTFDFGYLETYAAVDPVLRAMGWRAVMFLVSNRQERRDPAFVYWDRVQRMVDSGVWEIGAQGHLSHDPIPIDDRGAAGSFLADRKWLSDARRVETWEEFAARVLRDYEESKQTIESHLRAYQVLACAPRIGFSGAGGGRDVYQDNHDAMTAGYSLGFVDDRFGVSDRQSDPHRLKRLRVDPVWSPDVLMRRVHAALSDPPTRFPDRVAFSAWASGSGVVRVENRELVLTGTPRADVWLSGSQWASDWALEADVWTDGTEVWIVQESTRPGEAWRWGGHDRAAYLQRLEWGSVSETLATFPEGIEPRAWHRLTLVKRGSGLWVEWDGRPLADRPVYLAGAWRGNVGLVGWRSDAPAQVRLARLTLSRYPFDVRSVSARPTQAEVQALIRDARSIAAVSPLAAVVAGEDLYDVDFDRKLFAILSHRYGWEVVPTIRLLPSREVQPVGSPGETPRTGAGGWATDVLARVQDRGWGGLRVDSTALSPSERRRFDAALGQVERRLRGQELRFLAETGEGPVSPSSQVYASR